MSLAKPAFIVLIIAAVLLAACSKAPADPRPDFGPQVGPQGGGSNNQGQNPPDLSQNSALPGAAGLSDTSEEPEVDNDTSSTAVPINWSDNVTVTINEAAGTMSIQSDGLPNHATGDWSALANPRYVIAQTLSYTLPLDPQIAPTTSEVPMGPIGIMVNGVVFYNAYNAQRQDAVIAEANDFDDCLGHPDPMRSIYHYHQNPICIVNDDPGQHSYLIGFAFDGFPVYGPQGDGGTPPTDLDGCNGHTGSTPEYPEGTYHYHVTSTFPYILGCYSGTSTVGGPPAP